ncbi:hypothetical protein SBP28_003233 [Candidozyma auris]
MSTSISEKSSKFSTPQNTMSVLEAFNNLNVASARDISDHEAIFEISYKYLSQAMEFNHPLSFKNCIVALIKMDKYYKAVDLINKTNSGVVKQFPLEVAYVYYKVGDLDNVKSVYETASVGGADDTLSRALKHVLAQALYQKGAVAESLKIFHELISAQTIDSELDLACNERAIIFQLSLNENTTVKPQANIPASKQSYDYLFNDGLIALANGNIVESLQLLEQALDLCNKQNNDWPEEDLVLEAAPIKLSIAYIYQTTGREEEALELLNSFDAVAVSDLLVKAVLKTNYYSTLPANENLNLTQRSLNYKYLLHNLRLKLTRSQWRVMLKNHLLLSYQTESLSRSSHYISKSFAKDFGNEFEGDFSPVAYNVLVRLHISFEEFTNEETNKSVSKKLNRFVTEELGKNSVTESVVAGALLLAHLNSKFGNFDQSLEILERIVELELASANSQTLHAGVFGILISLYEVRKPGKLGALYDSLIAKLESIHKSQLKENDILYDFFKAVGFKLLNVSRQDLASKVFDSLASVKPDDAVISSVLSGRTDKLRPKSELASNTDVSELLDLNVEAIIPKHEVRARKTKTSKKSTHRVSKKNRKPRLPTARSIKPAEEFDPENDLDKERWLPMKLRSYYKPSKKDRKKAGGHQGALEPSPAPQSESKKPKKKKRGRK